MNWLKQNVKSVALVAVIAGFIVVAVVVSTVMNGTREMIGTPSNEPTSTGTPWSSSPTPTATSTSSSPSASSATPQPSVTPTASPQAGAVKDRPSQIGAADLTSVKARAVEAVAQYYSVYSTESKEAMALRIGRYFTSSSPTMASKSFPMADYYDINGNQRPIATATPNRIIDHGGNTSSYVLTLEVTQKLQTVIDNAPRLTSTGFTVNLDMKKVGGEWMVQRLTDVTE